MFNCAYGAGEFGRSGAGSDQKEPDESNEPRLRRRPDADLHADAARLVSAISRLEDVRFVAAAVTPVLFDLLDDEDARDNWRRSAFRGPVLRIGVFRIFIY